MARLRNSRSKPQATSSSTSLTGDITSKVCAHTKCHTIFEYCDENDNKIYVADVQDPGTIVESLSTPRGKKNITDKDRKAFSVLGFAPVMTKTSGIFMATAYILCSWGTEQTWETKNKLNEYKLGGNSNINTAIRGKLEKELETLSSWESSQKTEPSKWGWSKLTEEWSNALELLEGKPKEAGKTQAKTRAVRARAATTAQTTAKPQSSTKPMKAQSTRGFAKAQSENNATPSVGVKSTKKPDPDSNPEAPGSNPPSISRKVDILEQRIENIEKNLDVRF